MPNYNADLQQNNTELDQILQTVNNLPPAGDIGLGMTGATVGQIARIKAVDASGKPTEWEPVDMPKGYTPPPDFELIYEEEVLKAVTAVEKWFPDHYKAMIIGVKCPNPGQKHDLYLTAGGGTLKGVGVPYNTGAGYDSRMQIQEDHGVWDVSGMHGYDSWGTTQCVGPVGCATPVIVGYDSFQIPFLERIYVYVLSGTIDIHTKIKVWGRK